IAEADAEQVRALLGTLERSLAEATSAHEVHLKAGHEAGAQWDAERLTLREQWEREQLARVEEQDRFEATRRQWQEEREAVERQFDQERQELRAEAEHLRQEANGLRQASQRLSTELARASAGTGQGAERFRALQTEMESLKTQEALLRKELEAARTEGADS